MTCTIRTRGVILNVCRSDRVFASISTGAMFDPVRSVLASAIPVFRGTPSIRFGVVLVCAAVLLAATPRPLDVPIGVFSAQSPDRVVPDGWEQMAFRKRAEPTQYALVRVNGTVVVRARSTASASGLITRQRVDLRDTPVLEWRWKVEDVLDGGDARTKDGDDFAARVFVTFDYDDLGFGARIKRRALKALGYDDVPSRALVYVWANRIKPGTVLSSPYTDWVKTMALQSGPEHAGQWRREVRNVRADYRAAFGEEPPPVNGVALMTDTDDTGEAATAYYGDVRFRDAP